MPQCCQCECRGLVQEWIALLVERTSPLKNKEECQLSSLLYFVCHGPCSRSRYNSTIRNHLRRQGQLQRFGVLTTEKKLANCCKFNEKGCKDGDRDDGVESFGKKQQADRLRKVQTIIRCRLFLKPRVYSRAQSWYRVAMILTRTDLFPSLQIK